MLQPSSQQGLLQDLLPPTTETWPIFPNPQELGTMDTQLFPIQEDDLLLFTSSSSYLQLISSSMQPTFQSHYADESTYCFDTFTQDKGFMVPLMVEEEDDDGDGDDDDDDDDDHVYDFQINNNVDLVMEENSKCSNKSRIEVTGSESRSDNVEYEMEERKKDVSEIRVLNNTVKSHGRTRSQDRVSEWLWTLHQIGKFLFIVYDNRVIVNVSQIVNYNWSMVVLYTSSNLGAFFIVYCLLFFLIY